MNYNQYLFACLMKELIKGFKDLEYDLQFDEAIGVCEDFEKSNHNDSNVSTYECMVNYLNEIKDSLNYL